MLIGLETTGLYGKVTGTSRYEKCLLNTLNCTNNQIVTFSPATYQNRYINKISKNFYRQVSISREMKRAEIDYAIFPDYFLPFNFKPPAAIVIHDLSFISHPQFYSKSFVRIYTKQLNFTLKKNPLVITVSEHSKNQINKYLNIPMKDIYIVQGYVENVFLREYKKNDTNEVPYFLYSGHIEPRKNLNFLVRNFLSWREKRNSNIKLKIIGELWIRSKAIIEMVNKYRNNTYIEFTGYVTDEKLGEYYQNAAGFVHTSLEEGFGFPILEAMNYGLPLLCSDTIATAEISGSTSIKIDPQNDSSLLDGLDELYDKFLLNEKPRYSIPYSPQLMKNQLETVLTKLGEKSGGTIFHSYSPVVNAEEAIEKSLVYSNIFNSGINKSELPKAIFDAKINREELNPVLLKLTYEGKIINNDDYIKIVSPNDDYYKETKTKTDNLSVKRILRIIDSIPFISAVCFSGGTAHYGIEGHDDVDLFIITRANTVNIVYFIIHLLSLIYRVRSKFCANYLLDESCLKLDNQRDFYTAHQIISLKTYQDNGALGLFKFRNGWVNDFFPNFEITSTDYRSRIIIYKIFIPLNKVIKSFYKLLYRVKIKTQSDSGSLYFTDHSIKLHTNDHREKIIKVFYKAWEEYKNGQTYSYINPGSVKVKVL